MYVTEHWGYAPGTEKPAEQGNHRNGTSAKMVRTESGALPLDIRRDRDWTFASQLVPKGVRRLPQFDENALFFIETVVSWYGRAGLRVCPASVAGAADVERTRSIHPPRGTPARGGRNGQTTKNAIAGKRLSARAMSTAT
ncbi:MAG: transposase [Gemmatimonadaceae bacterium]